MSLHVCFIDEAGDLGALSNPPLPDEQPVLVIGGLFVDAAKLSALTSHFLDLKHHYFPGLRYPSLQRLDCAWTASSPRSRGPTFEEMRSATDRYEGGIVVSDAIARRNGSFMFR